MADVLIYPRTDPAQLTYALPDLVSEIESVLGRPLPPAYRTFLQNFNGGFPWPCDIEVGGTAVEEAIEDDIASVFEFYDAAQVLGQARKEVYGPATPTPFAFISDINGFDILLSLRPEDLGHCYVWSRTALVPWGTSDGDEVNDDRRLALIATDFASLVGSIGDVTGPGPALRNWERRPLRSSAKQLVVEG